MSNNQHEQDPTAEQRKKDHIDLALKSQVEKAAFDPRFDYEPMLSAHPMEGSVPPTSFLGKFLKMPVWVSSMTGGTLHAKTINKNLAKACYEFGMGMGLGSCRQLLYSDEHLQDFQVRKFIGSEYPLYANLGIAQLEELVSNKQTSKINELLDKLEADGLIVHVNPLQEAMQPEGDLVQQAPIDTIKELLERLEVPIIVKEVGQGFGPRSMAELLKLPLAAVEFAAGGGTNFAKLELLRSDQRMQDTFSGIARVGHSAAEMVSSLNKIVEREDWKVKVPHVIISGGVTSFLDGYYLIRNSRIPAVYGQASSFLNHAREDYESLQSFVSSQLRGLELAYAFLHPRGMDE